MSPDKAWKKFERRLSIQMGTRRIPVTGERLGADARTSMFSFQFKRRRIIPTYLGAWLAGICKTAARDGTIGVLVVNRPGANDKDALVILRWRDWLDLHGPSNIIVNRIEGNTNGDTESTSGS